MTLQSKLVIIGHKLAQTVENSYHYWRPMLPPPYLIWAEEGEDGTLNSDNIKQIQVISGTVDYFTKTEYDTAVDEIQKALNELSKTTGLHFSWQLADVLYENETNLIHWQWSWQVS